MPISRNNGCARKNRLQFNKVRSDGELETMFQVNGVKSLTAINIRNKSLSEWPRAADEINH